MPTQDEIFDRAHALTAQWEGGLSDDPDDRGGVTNYGVSLAFLKDLEAEPRGLTLLRSVGLPLPASQETVLAVTPDSAKAIFRAVFWEWPGVSRLPPLLAVVVYVFGVNAGSGQSVKLLQKALGVASDGIIGQDTLHAANDASDYAAAMDVIDWQETYYLNIVTSRPSQNKFLNGWLNRTNALRTLVTNLAVGTVEQTPQGDLRYFRRSEFVCKCGCGQGADRMDASLLSKLDAARADAGIPFSVASGFRCAAHNRAVGGVDGSAHTKGQAVDISCRNSSQRFAMVKALLAVGFTRIELAPSWLHVDVDASKPQNVAFYQTGGKY